MYQGTTIHTSYAIVVNPVLKLPDATLPDLDRVTRHNATAAFPVRYTRLPVLPL